MSKCFNYLILFDLSFQKKWESVPTSGSASWTRYQTSCTTWMAICFAGKFYLKNYDVL